MSLRFLIKKAVPRNLFTVLAPYGHLIEAMLFSLRYGFPARGLKVIGVTGTNGKTSTSFLIYEMLRGAGYKVGFMTTVAYGAGSIVKPQQEHMTTVGAPELMQRLRWMHRHEVEWLVLETTSHALAQYRVWGIPYSLAVMTNVTHEHLDYHRTFERYLVAKVRLFKLAARNRHGMRMGIVNADDPSWQLFAQAMPNVMTYGLQHGEVRATNVRLSPDGSDFVIKHHNSVLNVHLYLPGSFNVANALAAAATGMALGLTDQQISEGIAAVKSVEGRMTVVDEGQNFKVIVDFAHTPDSFEKLFQDLVPTVQGKLIVMFGSAGRRDETKRAVQGRLAGKYADIVVVTEEDDRDADAQQIMEAIASGAEAMGKLRDKNLFLIHDRSQAIAFTLKQAGKGDLVLLLGKGHEKTIERADGAHRWDEVATAKKVLRNL